VDRALRKTATESALFASSPTALHPPPVQGFTTADSFRTREAAGTLQLTFFVSPGGDETVVGMDIDLKSGLAKGFDLIRRAVTRQIVHPYAVQQVLIATQRIDPGYRLITNRDLAMELAGPPTK
jgi:hypothetical protein